MAAVSEPENVRSQREFSRSIDRRRARSGLSDDRRRHDPSGQGRCVGRILPSQLMLIGMTNVDRDPVVMGCGYQCVRGTEGSERAEEGGRTATMRANQPITIAEADLSHPFLHRQSGSRFLNRPPIDLLEPDSTSST